jgi:uncharacterized protein (DUF697 family)/uncharacterized tellurite resistance protein B-like protein
MATESEALASLRILVAVAKADGTVHPAEREALEAALEGVTLPAGATLQSLLDEAPDVAAQIAAITADKTREETYRSAFAMANADGEASPAELAVLDQLRKSFKIADEKVSITQRLFSEAKDTFLPSNIKKVEDPAKRTKEIKEDILKYSIMSAVLGAFPVPGLAIATDLAVVALQLKMVRDIGLYWGHNIDKKAAKALLGGLGLGTGVRIAVSNVMKLIPVWGSAVGAASSFATTYALGMIGDRWFETGMKAEMSALKDFFKKSVKEGKDVFKSNKDKVEAKSKESEAKLGVLNEELKAGKLTQAEYETKVAELK